MIEKRIRAAFTYNPDSGVLKWKTSPCNGVAAGTVAGCLSYAGYQIVEFENKRHYAHRLIWVVHYGRWPAKSIDHINGIKSDNRLCNLREASPAENAWNRTGVRGYAWCKLTKRWRVRMRVNGRVIDLGRFDTEAEARAAYQGAALVYHGQFYAKRKS